VLLDHQRRGVALDVQLDAERGGARRGEAHRQADRLAHRAGGHRGEAEEAVRRQPHLPADPQRERRLAAQTDRALDDLAAHAQRHAGRRVAQRLEPHRQAVHEIVGAHVPSLRELDEIAHVRARKIRRFCHWPQMITSRHAGT
jgi:hypothetical protein